MNLFYITLYSLFYYLISKCINASNIIVTNKEDFLLALNENNKDETIIIENSIYLEDTIEISSKISYIKIRGNENENSSITFENPNNKFIFNNQEYIDISNIKITGNLEFNNIKNVYLNNIYQIGCIQTSKMKNNVFSIKNSTIMLSENKNQYIYLINLIEGDNIIESSKVYGNDINPLTGNILYFNGNNIGSLNIKSSFFSGKKKSQCLSILNSNSINIEESEFTSCITDNQGYKN